jgi:hypothetical protein
MEEWTEVLAGTQCKDWPKGRWQRRLGEEGDVGDEVY